MNRPTVQLFINSRTGIRARARSKALQDALEAFGARILVTESIADQLTIDEQADHVCSVGGDGTLRHVVEAVRRTERAVRVSTYPTGTVNLFAMEYGYPRSPHAFARRLLDANEQRRHHGALVGATPMSVCGSVGPDSQAVAALSSGLKRVVGRAAYLFAFGKVLMDWPLMRMVLQHEGGQTPCEAVYVAKGRFFAGRWSFAPEANLSHPLLHVVALRHASRRRFLAFVWALLFRRPLEKLPGVQCFTCTELAITSDEPLPFQADGDVIARLPVTITLAGEAVTFA